LLDLLVLGGVWAAMIPALKETVELKAGLSLALSDLDFIFVILLAVVQIIWLPARLAPRTYALTDLVRRESIAVTLLEPRLYLRKKLKWTILRALAPAITVIPVFVCCTIIAYALPPVTKEYTMFLGFKATSTHYRQTPESVLLIIAACAIAYSAILFAVGGLMALVALNCRSVRTRGFTIAVLAGWPCISIGALVGWLYLSDGIQLAIGVIMIPVTSVFAYAQWKRAYQAYCRFE